MQIFENVRFTHCNNALYASLAEARISIEETGVSVAVNEQKEYYFELPSPEYEEEVLEEPQAV